MIWISTKLTCSSQRRKKKTFGIQRKSSSRWVLYPFYFHLFPSQCRTHTSLRCCCTWEARIDEKHIHYKWTRRSTSMTKCFRWSLEHFTLPPSETFRNASLWLFHASVGVYYDSLGELLATVNVKMRLVKCLKTLSSEMRWERDDYIIWW